MLIPTGYANVVLLRASVLQTRRCRSCLVDTGRPRRSFHFLLLSSEPLENPDARQLDENVPADERAHARVRPVNEDALAMSSCDV